MIFRIITEIEFCSKHLQLQIFCLYEKRNLFIPLYLEIPLTFQFHFPVVNPETLRISHSWTGVQPDQCTIRQIKLGFRAQMGLYWNIRKGIFHIDFSLPVRNTSHSYHDCNHCCVTPYRRQAKTLTGSALSFLPAFNAVSIILKRFILFIDRCSFTIYSRKPDFPLLNKILPILSRCDNPRFQFV